MKKPMRILVTEDMLNDLSEEYQRNKDFNSFSIFIETLLFLGLREVNK